MKRMKEKRNMATHKQILAGLLALVMVFTTAFSMPVTGYAAEATGDMGAAQTGAEAGLTDPTEDGGEQQPGGVTDAEAKVAELECDHPDHQDRRRGKL